MGKLKEEIFSLIHGFLNENKAAEEEHFIRNLKNFIKTLSSSIPRNSVIIHTDGSSKGNPGPARIGIQFTDSQNNILLRESREIGIKTNNQAEYTAVREALKMALEKNYRNVVLFSDSQVVIHQLNNLYKIKDPGLRKFYDEIKKIMEKFEEIKLVHIKREKNKTADILSN
ncbi:MAG: ribonuclease HI family protein [bacterium]|nr:ribonuclease HI family protein [bacterium]